MNAVAVVGQFAHDFGVSREQNYCFLPQKGIRGENERKIKRFQAEICFLGAIFEFWRGFRAEFGFFAGNWRWAMRGNFGRLRRGSGAIFDDFAWFWTISRSFGAIFGVLGARVPEAIATGGFSNLNNSST
ncbi:MAG: hypothetical protein GX803_03395 [Lentisphaerae bacterium]|jgi:hypothetical protein|nr:hypothetical protein [Lentisphaerota bacterium]